MTTVRGVRIIPAEQRETRCEGAAHVDDDGPWPVATYRVAIVDCPRCGEPCRWHAACADCLARLREEHDAERAASLP